MSGVDLLNSIHVSHIALSWGPKGHTLTCRAIPDPFQFLYDFDDRIYPTFADAQLAQPRWRDGAPVAADVASLDTLTVVVCDPYVYVKIDRSYTDFLWRDSTTNGYYIITDEPEICPPGLKTRLAAHRGEPFHFIIILCPEVLTQTDGQYKMFATLGGDGLTNTRPQDVGNPLDMHTWVGMSIDQLRERVLSVYLGRMVIYIQAQKYAQNISSESRWSFLDAQPGPLTSQSQLYAAVSELRPSDELALVGGAVEPRFLFAFYLR